MSTRDAHQRGQPLSTAGRVWILVVTGSFSRKAHLPCTAHAHAASSTAPISSCNRTLMPTYMQAQPICSSVVQYCVCTSTGACQSIAQDRPARCLPR
ncbi:hypothetical protein TRIATDRAFT_297586 [Trichoderma atroviride IMI 206040]|uniref:Uncharacterized protein n=1 Tax=Hypocrea atroviridis (strain ATCC 20476 / IMI 206040) TaxID=452589 RepID=G9NIR5_HYPAI|nr:uncharacterized protein TRIATDRAFT_297586 [Trichoderma atroviride IMI 206040]EHK49675.1 hypothetical protein TRIATDRAFT_297586 [Trichoderma atroviride IMI 206040]